MGGQWPEQRQVEQQQMAKRSTPEAAPRDSKATLRRELRGMDYEAGAARLAPPAARATRPGARSKAAPEVGGMSTVDGACEPVSGHGMAVAGQTAAPPAIEETRRTRHEWRMALVGARSHVADQVRFGIQERYNRDSAALTGFAQTVAFAKEENVVGLVLGSAFGALVLPVDGILAGIVGALSVASDIYSKADAASQSVSLQVWIEQHRGALERLRETQVDPATNPALMPLTELIEALVADESYEGERKKQELESAMTGFTAKVSVTAAELELHLYSAWCQARGGRFVAHAYETGRDYPGQEEIGTTDQNHPGFKGRQIYPENIPTEILDRLGRPGLDPQDPRKPVDPLRLNVPVDTMHHKRAPGGIGAPTWQDAGVTHLQRGGAR